MLLFDETTGICIKEIGGDAVPDAGIAFERPAGLENASLRYLRLVAGVVTKLDPTADEAQADLEGRIRDRLLRTFIEDRFELENRLRALEAKASITRSQFLDALKARVGL